MILLSLLMAGMAGASARIAGPGESAAIGEVDLNFTNGTAGPDGSLSGCATGTLVGPVDGISGGVAQNSLFVPFSGGSFNARDAGLVPGRYNLTCGAWNATPSKVDSTFFTFVRPFPDAAMRTTSAEAGYAGRGVGAVARGDRIVLNATTYVAPVKGCTLFFLVRDPSGAAKTTTASLAVSASGAANTTLTVPVSWDTGNYTALVKTNSTACNSLDAESGGVAFRVVDAGVTLSASKSVVTQDREFSLLGTAQPFKLAQIANNPLKGDDANVGYVGGSGFSEPGTQLAGTDATPGRSCSNVGGWGISANLTTSASNISKGTACMRADSNGNFGVNVKLSKKFIYEFNASLVGAGGTQPTVTVKAESVSATVTTDKSNYTVGERVRFLGTATGGEYVAIALNSRVYFNDTRIKGDDTFTEEWDTSGELPGTRFIEVWVCPSSINKAAAGLSCWPATGSGGRGTPGLDIENGITKTGPPPGDLAGPGASASFNLNAGSLTASISPAKVAQDDQPELSGNALGVEKIFYWAFNSKGTTSGGKCRTASPRVIAADGYKFKESISQALVEDPGEVTVFLQTLGRDLTYSDKGAGATNPLAFFDCKDEDATKPGLVNKLGNSILTVLKDAAGKPGSDDFETFKILKFTVEPRQLSLSSCGSQVLGRYLAIAGKSNRVDKRNISVSLPAANATQVTTVTKGAFSATFSTAGLAAGKYTVVAEYPEEGRTPDRPTASASATTICELVPGTPASLSVAEPKGPSKAEAGENVTFSVAVSNTGDSASGPVNVNWSVGEKELKGCASSRSVSGKGSEVFTCAAPFDAAGTFNLSITVTDGKTVWLKSLALQVEAPKKAPPSATPTAQAALEKADGLASKTPSPRSPGFETLLAVAALGMAAMAARRRRS